MTTVPRGVRLDRRERGGGGISRRGDSFEVSRRFDGKTYRQTVHEMREAREVLARWSERAAQGLPPDPAPCPRRRG